jgi:DNA-binding NarL/FixJ family response regulator
MAVHCEMGPVRLIIVDDDPAVRMMLRSIAEGLGANVLGEAENGRGGIEQAELLQPEMMLLDVSMPVMGGFPAARYLREHIPDLRIVLVSQFNQKAYADEAMQLGARGYILKSAVASELGVAMEAIMNGGTFVSPRVSH